MRKFLIAFCFTGTAAIMITAFGGSEAHSSSGGAPAGKTGSPGDGGNCTGCHTGTATTQTSLITSDIPVSGYVPGTTYTITASVSKTGINKFGFEISPQNTSGQL